MENRKPKYFSDEWFEMKEKTTGDVSFRLQPDDITCWEGLIAPNGDFYSCGFGMHAVKAWRLIVTHPEKFGMEIEEEQKAKWMCPENVYLFLDMAIQKGWAATREIGGQSYISYPMRPTKAQVNAIFDAMEKHQIRINPDELLCC